METYSKAFTVTNNMLDAFDNLMMSSILDISQEIAGDHANLLHVGFDEFIKRVRRWKHVIRCLTFLLSKYKI